jgi:phenylpyruvate tautomerase PptA (4-oxalocrotonate tautomerase family)
MPLITVTSSATSPAQAEVDQLLKQLSARIADHLGKPESYVMTAFKAGVPMTFAGNSDEPVALLQVKSVGTLSPQITAAISADLCPMIEERLGIPASRTYIEFMAVEGHLWGWNGRTFG